MPATDAKLYILFLSALIASACELYLNFVFEPISYWQPDGYESLLVERTIFPNTSDIGLNKLLSMVAFYMLYLVTEIIVRINNWLFTMALWFLADPFFRDE
ncbi:hypothetical protein F2P56_020093 [Juglans regia]|uniref:Uncharacterized protein n=1 Tax=Juglans regia TaxID=51240 RepID=A0A833X4T0_JUGRE|nr:hypothetical protein F2P56_020093 [Juglans regia]